MTFLKKNPPPPFITSIDTRRRFGLFAKKSHRRSNSTGDASRATRSGSTSGRNSPTLLAETMGAKWQGFKASVESLVQAARGSGRDSSTDHDIDFLKDVRRAAATDISNHIKAFLKSFESDLRSLNPAAQSERILAFYDVGCGVGEGGGGGAECDAGCCFLF